uniref:Uncharacterized protein n=1 Tax=Romanomermis culicivorax TaxID=13658 RepID=A0A915KU33_ROMCU
MEQEKPEVVIIADPPIADTPATRSKGAVEEEKLMEIVETESEKQPELEKLTEQIKEKEKIEILEKEKYGKAAIELTKQLENMKAEEEGTSEELFVEVVSEIGSDEEYPGLELMFCPLHQYMLRLVGKMWKILRTLENLRK